jgi:hypothetical protein
MRTKTLLLTAVLGVAGAASTTVMAQTSVYSQNTVGYVNLSLGIGFTIIANPLNNTTNNLNTILTNVPASSIIYTFNGLTQSYVQSSFAGGTWHPDQLLNPGTGAFIKLTTAGTVTFVGNVPQGSLSNTVPVGFSLQALPIPVSVSLTNSIVNLHPGTSDIVYNFPNAGQAYVQHSYAGTSFHPDYVPAVGEGFFYLNKNSTFNWAVTFTTQ